MRSSLSLRTFALFSALLSCIGCMEPRYPDEFDESVQSVWGSDAASIAPALDAAAAPVGGPSGFLPTQPVGPLGGLADAGRGDLPPRVDAGGNPLFPRPPDAGAPQDTGAPTPFDAGSEADAGSDPVGAGALTSCSISASTDASDTFFYAGKYGCALWIANASNKAVKVFFVATRIANRTGLNAYRSATSGMSVDVVAGATLNAPKQHQYTWDLTDASGAALAPGRYSLTIETHSSNGVTVVTVPFDTSKGEVSEMATPNGEVRSASITCQ
jgi:hypothetical protein